MIPPCNNFIVVLSDSILDMSVILSGSPFIFDTGNNLAITFLFLYFLAVFVNWNAPLQSFLLL